MEAGATFQFLGVFITEASIIAFVRINLLNNRVTTTTSQYIQA